MSAVQLYRAYCLACHDADGRGTIIRKAMPNVPDFTDPKWQAGCTTRFALAQVTLLSGRKTIE